MAFAAIYYLWMMSKHHQLALYTFGIFKRPSDDAANEGFHLRNNPILGLVDRSPGMIARSGYESDPGPASWGKQVYPRFYVEQGDGFSPSTLSLWSDLESVFAFTYFGLHAEAMAHCREWFQKPQWPPYVLWWIKVGENPAWADGVARHEHLHDHGPSAFAFNFKNAFDWRGQAVELDHTRARKIAARP